MKFSNLIFSVLLLLSSAECFSATWYVSTSGNDNGAGSFANPFQTIPKAIAIAQNGDVIELRGGNYNSEEIRITKNNLTIKSYTGEWAIITAPLTMKILHHASGTASPMWKAVRSKISKSLEDFITG